MGPDFNCSIRGAIAAHLVLPFLSVLIIAESDKNPHVKRVCSVLESLGQEFSVFGVSQAKKSRVSLELHKGRLTGEIAVSGYPKIMLDSVKSVWLQYPALPWSEVRRSSQDINVASASMQAIHREWNWLVVNLYFLTSEKFWINQPLSALLADSKLSQLQVAADVGLQVPTSIVTNDVKAYFRFRHEHLDMALKPFSHGISTFLPPGYTIYTTKLKGGLPPDAVSLVKYSPNLFQEYVEKDAEIRAYVIGDEVLTAEILSQEYEGTREDWRRYPLRRTGQGKYEIDFDKWKCRQVILPEDLRSNCVQLVKRLGLHFAGLDFIKHPNGEYIFLEANAVPAFLWLEDHAGLPISKAIGKSLVRGTEHRKAALEVSRPA